MELHEGSWRQLQGKTLHSPSGKCERAVSADTDKNKITTNRCIVRWFKNACLLKQMLGSASRHGLMSVVAAAAALARGERWLQRGRFLRGEMKTESQWAKHDSGVLSGQSASMGHANIVLEIGTKCLFQLSWVCRAG